MSKAKPDTFASVWDAIVDDVQERANLRVRSDLMSKLAAIVVDKGWSQAEAGKRCGVTQPRINDLLRGRISRFSLDALVNVAAALGQRVNVELNAVGRARRGRRQASGVTQRTLVATRKVRRAGAEKKGNHASGGA